MLIYIEYSAGAKLGLPYEGRSHNQNYREHGVDRNIYSSDN